MSSNISKETDSSTTVAITENNQTISQAGKPLVQLAVFAGCGIACGFVFEKARGINTG